MWQKLHWRNRQTSSREHGHNLQQGLLEKSKLTQHAYEEGHRAGWDDARVLEIESNSRYRKYKESAHMTCLTSSAMRFLTHRVDLYNLRDSSLVSIRVQSRGLRCYTTDGASGRYHMSSQISPDGHYLSLFCIYNIFSHNKKILHTFFPPISLH
jgi:hypothetical protein